MVQQVVTGLSKGLTRLETTGEVVPMAQPTFCSGHGHMHCPYCRGLVYYDPTGGSPDPQHCPCCGGEWG